MCPTAQLLIGLVLGGAFIFGGMGLIKFMYVVILDRKRKKSKLEEMGDE